RDRAAVHVDLVGIEAEFADAGDRLRGERFVDLDEVEVVDRQTGALQRLRNRFDRAGSRVRGLDARARPAADDRARLQPELPRAFGARHDDRGAGVVDTARVAGRDGAAFLVVRLESRELLQARVAPRPLVDREDVRFALALRDGDGKDLALEAVVVDRR